MDKLPFSYIPASNSTPLSQVSLLPSEAWHRGEDRHPSVSLCNESESDGENTSVCNSPAWKVARSTSKLDIISSSSLTTKREVGRSDEQTSMTPCAAIMGGDPPSKTRKSAKGGDGGDGGDGEDGEDGEDNKDGGYSGE